MGIVQKASLRLTIISYAGFALGAVNKAFLLTNFLTDDKVGLINLFTSLSVMYAQFAALGMGSVSMRFFPYFQDREKKHHGFLFWGSCIVMAGFLIVTALYLLFKPYIIKHYAGESPLIGDFYNYLIPLSFAFVFFQFYDTYLRALLKTVVSTFLGELLQRITTTVCISFYAFKLVTFQQFVLLFVLSYCAITLIQLIYMAYLRQLHFTPVKSRVFKRLFKIMMVYGLFTILSSLGAAVLRNVDSIMVTGILNLSQTGIYTTLSFFPVLMSLPFRSIQRITYPLIARYWKAKDMVSMRDVYTKTTTVTMAMGGLLFLAIWVNMDSIFSFMPKEYANGRYVFLYLAMAGYVDMITGLNGIIMITSKKYKYDLWFLALLVGLTVIMNLIFIPKYGITGAALATAVSVIFYNIVRVACVQYFFKMQPFTINCLWVLAVTVLTWFVSLYIPQTDNRYINVAMNTAIISVIYGAIIVGLRLSPDINQYAYNITKWKFLLPGEERESK